jgi:RNA polymerase sigma-70 factor (ECF subfamily)
MQSQIAQLYNPLLGYVKKRINSCEDAEDLTQDIFLKLSKSNKDGVDNLKSWLYTIAKNTITDYYRKKKIINEEIEDSIFTSEVDNSNEATEELGKCVGAFVNQLPNEYRELLTLSELKNIPQKEIAEQLDMNYVTVRSKVQLGRKKLKDLFEGCCTVLQGGKGSITDFENKSGCNKTSSCD